MKVCIALGVMLLGFAHSYGVRPAFEAEGGWAHMRVSSHGDHVSGDFATMGLGTTIPYSKYMGLRADIFGLVLGEDQTTLGVASRIGLIEMIPTKHVSPYFVQDFALYNTSSQGESVTDLLLAGGLGVEFLSSSYVSPFIEGSFGWNFTDFDGFSINTIMISVGGGIRVSWKR